MFQPHLWWFKWWRLLIPTVLLLLILAPTPTTAISKTLRDIVGIYLRTYKNVLKLNYVDPDINHVDPKIMLSVAILAVFSISVCVCVLVCRAMQMCCFRPYILMRGQHSGLADVVSS